MIKILCFSTFKVLHHVKVGCPQGRVDTVEIVSFGWLVGSFPENFVPFFFGTVII